MQKVRETEAKNKRTLETRHPIFAFYFQKHDDFYSSV